jgi:hypothetical protein
MTACASSDYLASSDPRAIVYLELAHHNHWLAIGQDAGRWTAMIFTPVPGSLRWQIRAEVGLYSAERETDFVADVYHGLTVGSSDPSRVFALYNDLGGPPL